MASKKSPFDIEQALLRMAREEGYRHARVIDGVLCTVHPQAFTFGLFVGLDEYGYERRYCYEKLDDALTALQAYTDPRGGHAPGPWIKVKGNFRGSHVDELNPALMRDET
jgi:hypothetical protein